MSSEFDMLPDAKADGEFDALPDAKQPFDDLPEVTPTPSWASQMKQAVVTALEEEGLRQAGEQVARATEAPAPTEIPGPAIPSEVPFTYDATGTTPGTAEALAKAGTEPFFAIPTLPVKPGEPASIAATKAAWNLAKGTVEFVESPLGISAAAASTVAAPVVAGAFLLDTLKGLSEQSSDLMMNWNNLTPAEKAEGAVNTLGLGVFSLLMGGGVVKGAKSVAADIQAAHQQKQLAGLRTTQAALPPASGQATAGPTPIGTVVDPVVLVPTPVKPPGPVSPIFAPDPTPVVEVLRTGEMGTVKLESVVPERPASITLRNRQTGEMWDTGVRIHAQVPWKKAPSWVREWLHDPEKPSWMFKSGNTDVLENVRTTTRGRVVTMEEAQKLEGEATAAPTAPTPATIPTTSPPPAILAPPPPPTGTLPPPWKGGPVGITPSAWVQGLFRNLVDSRWVGRQLTKERGLNPEDYAAWRKREGKVGAQAAEAMFAAQDLQRALMSHAGVKTTVGLLKWAKTNPGVLNDINLTLAGQHPTILLPQEVQAPVMAMRAHVDALSNYLLANNLVAGRIRATVGNNLGSYLNRSYRVFEDPKYGWESAPLQVRNAAIQWLNQVRGLTPAAAETTLRNMMQDFKDSGADQLWKGGKLGSKDITSLMRRKNIDPVIRDLMGEYKDPFVNYLRTVSKLSRLVADQEFLTEVRSHGMGTWLFDSANAPNGFNSLIAGKGSHTMSPLNGLRTSPAMAAIFNEWGAIPAKHNWAVDLYLRANAATKAMKTVYSVMTHARNLLGQPFFWAMNGHYNPLAIRNAVEMIKTERGLNTDPAWRDYYKQLTDLGLVGESAYSGELRAMLQDFSTKLADPNVSPLSYSTGKALKGLVADAPAWLYHITDEFGKVVGFENEIARQMRDNPGWSYAEAAKEAGERVRNTYPTYSNISKAAQLFRHVPLTGPFMGFAYESMRTTAHSLHYAVQDFQAGHYRSAAERGAGALLALGAGSFGLQALSKYMAGVTKEDEQDVRRNLPPWEKNSALLFAGKEDGKISRINISYVNPYSYLTDPVLALAAQNHDTVRERIVAAGAEFLGPYVSEQMLASALLDWKRNTTKDGRRVYNPEDKPEKQTEDVLKHLWTAVGPGTPVRLQTRILPAARGEPQAQGTLTGELLAEFTGFREVTMDFAQAVRQAGFAANERLRNAGQVFTEGIGSLKPSDDLVQKYRDSEDARFDILRDLHAQVQGARRQGLSDGVIAKQLSASGLEKQVIGSVMQGMYMPDLPGAAVGKRAADAGKKLPMQEIGKEAAGRAGKPLE